MKLGFIDYFLDEWHANNYPDWFKKYNAELGLDVELTYAFGDTEKGLSTAQWCEKFGVAPVASVNELVEKSDCILVLSPDNPEQHERLCDLALRSGKRVYVDKTFAPDLDAGKRLFDLAGAHGTPMFSSSALRFARELEGFRQGTEAKPALCAVRGPGVYANYAIHQLEMIDAVMGQRSLRVKALSAGSGNVLWFEFEDGLATMTQQPGADFGLDLAYEKEGRAISSCTDTFDNLIRAMLRFFSGEAAPVARENTLHALALRDAGLKALAQPDTWIRIER